VLNTIDNDLAAIRAAGGLAYIAHPNFYFAVSAEDLVNASGTPQLFEVYNAHPVVNNTGDATHPSVEANWDTALTQGKFFTALLLMMHTPWTIRQALCRSSMDHGQGREPFANRDHTGACERRLLRQHGRHSAKLPR
jgi:hypothetical protein